MSPVNSFDGIEWKKMYLEIFLPGECPDIARLSVTFNLFVAGMHDFKIISLRKTQNQMF